MSQPFPEQVVPGGVLVYPQIRSPDYVAGVSGWAVKIDGSAEFNNLISRGHFISENGPLTIELTGGQMTVSYNGTEVFTLGAGGLGVTSLYSLGKTSGDNTGLTLLSDAALEGPAIWCQAGPLAATEFIIGPSGDTTGATDYATISGALAGPAGFPAAGYTVRLMPGTYYLSQSLAMPDGSCLTAHNPSWGIPTGNYGAGSLPLQGAIIRAGTAFAGAALISLGSAGAVQHGSQRIYGITLSGTGAPAGIHGILSTGYVGAVKIRDVVVWGMPGDGLHAVNDGTAGHNPDFWHVASSKFSDCAWGVFVQSLADTWFTDCECTGNSAGGWSITDGADSRWTSCRGDSNGGVPGWSVTLDTGANLQFTNCEATLSGTGWEFAGNGGGTVCLSGCLQSGNTTAYSYSGTSKVRCDGGNFTVWVALAPQNSWANSGSGPSAQYCWRGSSIEVIADLTAGTLTAGTAVLTLPAIAHAQTLTLQDITTRGAQAQLNVGTGGTAAFFQGIGTVAAADRCFVHGFVSTDA